MHVFWFFIHIYSGIRNNLKNGKLHSCEFLHLINTNIQKSSIYNHGRDIHIHGPEYYILVYYTRDPYSNPYS